MAIRGENLSLVSATMETAILSSFSYYYYYTMMEDGSANFV